VNTYRLTPKEIVCEAIHNRPSHTDSCFALVGLSSMPATKDARPSCSHLAIQSSHVDRSSFTATVRGRECLFDRCLAAKNRGLAGNAGVTKDN